MRYVLGFLTHRVTGQVLLIRKARPDWQAGKLNGIGGKIEEGEGAVEAMRREFREEAGFDVLEWKMFGQIDHSGNTVYLFKAVGTGTPGYWETDELCAWFDPSNLYRPMPNLSWLIPLARSESNEFIHVVDNTKPWESSHVKL